MPRLVSTKEINLLSYFYWAVYVRKAEINNLSVGYGFGFKDAMGIS